MIRPIPRRWAGFLHPKKGKPYHRVNSRRGVRRAYRRWMRQHSKEWRRRHPQEGPAIDLDLHVTLDGVPICTHWPRPMRKDQFRGPNGDRRHQWRRVWTLPWSEVRQWRAPGGYRIWRYTQLMREAARLGVRVEIEAKPSPQLAHPAVWRRLARVRDETGLDCQVKVLSTNPHAKQILRQAKRHGFITIILPRGPIPRDWAPYIDRRRGPVRWK